ncbi:hypothetical protein ACVCAH_11045 [Micromonospora sp. LZ34]
MPSAARTPEIWPLPVARTRVKLLVFTTLTVVAGLAGMPGPTVAALALISLAIPLAVALAGGAGLLRDLLGPPARPTPDCALGHTPEQGERFVT